MRIAVISDVHGNLTALEAVCADLKQTAPDVVVQGGDLPASGSRGAEVIDRVRALGWPGVQGNTDEMLWRPELFAQFRAQAPAQAELWNLVEETAAATVEAIGPERLDWLRSLPKEWRVPGVAIVHASPGDLWQSPAAAAPDAELERVYGPLRVMTAVYGHIHQPFVRRVADFTVANCGSVSLSYDGDRRASYALLEDAKVTIRRVEYDIEEEIGRLKEACYPSWEWIAALLRSAAFVPPAARRT
jgi:putative phosphoesterase